MRKHHPTNSFPFHFISSTSDRLPSVWPLAPLLPSLCIAEIVKGLGRQQVKGKRLATPHYWSLGPPILAGLESRVWPTCHTWKFWCAFCTIWGVNVCSAPFSCFIVHDSILSCLKAILTLKQWFSKFGPEPAMSAWPGKWLKLQIFRPHPQPLNQKLWGWYPIAIVFFFFFNIFIRV